MFKFKRVLSFKFKNFIQINFIHQLANEEAISEKTSAKSWENIIIKRLHSELMQEQARFSQEMRRINARNQVLR